MPDIKTRRTMAAVLRTLEHNAGPMGAERIAEELRLSGVELSERTVRNYLIEADACGWTENLGRRGRRLTEAGRKEVQSALVIDKVGFVAARVETLAYEMDFDLESRQGRVVLNISTIAKEEFASVPRLLGEVFGANLGMGRLFAVAEPGETLGGFRVPRNQIAVGTVCSVSINGIFLKAGIPTTSRFGGLLEIERGRPLRFNEIIFYEGSSLDPLEIFIRGHMTSVGQAARTGSGAIGASFREIPAVSLSEVRRLSTLSEKAGIGGLMVIGRPSQSVLDIPVSRGRVGIVVCGGLNPLAALVEKGISVENRAMSTLCPFDRLTDFRSYPRTGFCGGRLDSS